MKWSYSIDSITYKGFFSEMQLGFQEGVSCTKASFTILETISHILERSSKVFSCFLDVLKALDTVWIDGILYKLFSELGIGDRMWKVMKNLYTSVKAQVLYAGPLSSKINVSQGTEQGRIIAPLLYKVYVKRLLCMLTNHCHAIFINGPRILSPLFADDITLRYILPSSKLSWVFATNIVSASNGDMSAIIPRVKLLHFVNLSHKTFSP